MGAAGEDVAGAAMGVDGAVGPADTGEPLLGGVIVRLRADDPGKRNAFAEPFSGNILLDFFRSLSSNFSELLAIC